MHSRFRMKGVLVAALLALVASVALPHRASAEPEPGAKKKGFRLFARALGAMTINRVYCGMASDGQICVDSTNSSTIGGGFWPKGTADQYIFNSGLQVAGIIGNDGGPWAGDTVGGFFFDPKGTTQHGEEVQPIYNSSNPADLAAWPEAACVPYNPLNPGDEAPTLFDNLLQLDSTNTSTAYSYPCRKSASQGDIWFVSWEGNPAFRAGRKHPIGVLVETRGMGWNFPSGNEDILYFIYTFYNVTSTNAADYASYRPSLRPILLQKANDFHAAVAASGVTLPANGYTMTNLFAAFARDDDVGSAGANYSSVNLPFALGFTYDHGFSPNLPGWRFDASIFSTPFFPGVGFTGAKYLKSPSGAGEIQLFSNTINGQPFAGAVNDPRDVVQLYRYLSGTLSPATGDQACNTGIQSQTRVCFINNTSSQDMRFFQSSTPLVLAPGGSGSIVVAYIFAPPVRVAGSVNNTDVKPGDPRRLTTPAQLTVGANLVDSMTGFRGWTDGNADGVVQQGEISVVPKSLLGKAQVAQSVFDFKFLLPFAPSGPEFFLVPGDDQVTVLWKPSSSEDSGDPFANIAGAPKVTDPVTHTLVANALYDPNYRKFDVEGYRIYRSRVDAPNEMVLLAQFDYAGTIITDYTGIVNPTSDCAPEYAINTGCATLAPNLKNGTALLNNRKFDLVGQIVETKSGSGRVPLASGIAQLLSADTVVTGGGTLGSCGPRSACPALGNTGVPFSYIDRTPRNNFRYFYSVTAFDVNSIESGPTSLESPRNTKPVRPVRAASNYLNSSSITVHVGGRGVGMDTLIPNTPTINATSGVFSGPSQPANGMVVGFVGELAKQVLAAPGSFSVTLDSMVGGEADFSCCGGMGTVSPNIYYFTAQSGALVTKITLPVQMTAADGSSVAGGEAFFSAVSVDPTLAASYGGNGSFQLQGALSDTVTNAMLGSAQALGCRIKAGPITGGTNDCIYAGPRWFVSTVAPTSSPLPSARVSAETFADPTSGNCKHDGGNGPVCAAVSFNNGGSLAGVTTIHFPQSYSQLIRRWRNVEAVTAPYWRAADMNVYWGAAGRIDSVIDVTHNVVIPDPFIRNGAGAVTGLRKLGPNWGILNPGKTNVASTSSDARPAVFTAADLPCFEPMRSSANAQVANGDGFPCNPTGAAAYGLGAAFTPDTVAVPGPIAFFKDTRANSAAAAAAPGGGFALWVSGTITMFEMAGGAVPAAGTIWTLRTYAGMSYGGQGVGGGSTGLPYSYTAADRPFSAVGASASVVFDVTNQLQAARTADLKRVHTVPDPYYVTNSFEQSTDNKIIKFVNLPAQAIIRIYSSSGVLVSLLENPGPSCQNVNAGGVIDNPTGGECTWNVRNRNNQVVASGVYFYHIESNSAGGVARRVGRMTIVNFAQ